ncbi:zinc knuckle CX2CX4HX4C containing protein [Tanacetum coccineum]
MLMSQMKVMLLVVNIGDNVITKEQPHASLSSPHIGKRLAFLIVENYVKNAWTKFRIERVMLQNEFFFFQFSNTDGMERAFENGPWLIRLVPIILNVWTPTSKLKKDDITMVPVWIKLHNVPIVAYSEVGLSLLTTQLGKPIMLDCYTSNMCVSSWGRNSYARALIEIFDHFDDKCPKKPKEINQNKQSGDGFVEVTNKKGKAKQPKSMPIEGIHLNKSTHNFYYRPINNKQIGKNDGASTSHQTMLVNEDSFKTSIDIRSDQVAKRHTSEVHSNSMSIKNSCAALADKDLLKEDTNVTKNVSESCGYDSDIDGVENIIME